MIVISGTIPINPAEREDLVAGAGSFTKYIVASSGPLFG